MKVHESFPGLLHCRQGINHHQICAKLLRNVFSAISKDNDSNLTNFLREINLCLSSYLNCNLYIPISEIH